MSVNDIIQGEFNIRKEKTFSFKCLFGMHTPTAMVEEEGDGAVRQVARDASIEASELYPNDSKQRAEYITGVFGATTSLYCKHCRKVIRRTNL